MMTNSTLYTELLRTISHGKPCLLATVIDTQGSAPQKHGASALFDTNGLLYGTIGGGSVEYKVMIQSKEFITHNTSGIFTFDLAGDIQQMDEVICGGRMNLLLDSSPWMHKTIFEQVVDSLETHVPGVLLTVTDQSEKEGYQINRYWITMPEKVNLLGGIYEQVFPHIKAMLAAPRSGDFRSVDLIAQDPGHLLKAQMETIVPSPSLIIAGAGHIGKVLVQLGKLLDFEVTAWDDRQEYANTENIPLADHILSGNFESTLSKIEMNQDTYLVIVTRGHQKDGEVLRKFIHSDVAYIGMIGSKRKVKQMRDYFLEQEWATREAWDRIHAPVGLDIGALTVEEIAISIFAEIIQVRNQKLKRDG